MWTLKIPAEKKHNPTSAQSYQVSALCKTGATPSMWGVCGAEPTSPTSLFSREPAARVKNAVFSDKAFWLPLLG